MPVQKKIGFIRTGLLCCDIGQKIVELSSNMLLIEEITFKLLTVFRDNLDIKLSMVTSDIGRLDQLFFDMPGGKGNFISKRFIDSYQHFSSFSGSIERKVPKKAVNSFKYGKFTEKNVAFRFDSLYRVESFLQGTGVHKEIGQKFNENSEESHAFEHDGPGYGHDFVDPDGGQSEYGAEQIWNRSMGIGNDSFVFHDHIRAVVGGRISKTELWGQHNSAYNAVNQRSGQPSVDDRFA